MKDSAPPVARQDLEALSHFRYQLRRYLRFSEQASRRAGVTPLQYLLLLHIGGFPGRDRASVGELAERLQASHHGTASLITRCEKGGLVERSPDPADGRRVEVRLTGKGTACLARLARTHRAELLSLHGQFAVPDLRSLGSDRGAPETGPHAHIQEEPR